MSNVSNLPSDTITPVLFDFLKLRIPYNSCLRVSIPWDPGRNLAKFLPVLLKLDFFHIFQNEYHLHYKQHTVSGQIHFHDSLLLCILNIAFRQIQLHFRKNIHPSNDLHKVHLVLMQPEDTPNESNHH